MRAVTSRAVAASALLLALGAAFVVVALGQFKATTERLEAVISQHAEMAIAVERLRVTNERIGRTGRSYLLTRDDQALDEMHEARERFAEIAAELSRRDAEGHLGQALRTAVDLEARYGAALGALFALQAAPEAERSAAFRREVQPLRTALTDALAALSRDVDLRFRDARDAAAAAAARALRLVFGVAGLFLVLAVALTFAVTRTLALLARNRAELQQSHDRLEVVNHDLDAFAGRIAHDLRNVLAPMGALSARLRRARDASVMETAERLDALARRSSRLIESLLAFARGGAVPGDSDRACVGATVREVVDDVAPMAAEVGARICLDVAEARVRCAPGLLYTVVANLVGNAVKYVAGHETREVSVVVRAVDGYCTIAVADTGPGIPEEWRSRIFEPFVRVPGTGASGSGIGLATVLRIVRAHGGEVAVQPGRVPGTTIAVKLPLAPREDVEAGAVGAQR
jgi:signal transduction histidine kinase